MMLTPETPVRDGNLWLFPDGTVLPVVSGGAVDDAPPAADGGGDTPPAADGNPSGGQDPSGAPADDTDPFDDEGVEQFSRSYVKRLRDEAAKHRTELNELREQFKAAEPLVKSVHPEDLPNFAQALADLYSTDEGVRTHAARWLASVGAKAGGAKRDVATLWEDVQAAVEDAEDELDRDLTPAEVQKLIDEALAGRDRQAQEQAAAAEAQQRQEAIEATLEEAGYGRKDGKPNLEALMILARAAELDTVEGDHVTAVKQAIEAHEAAKAEERRQIEEAAVAAFLEGKKRDAEGAPRLPGDGSPVADPAPTADRLADKEARRAELRAIFQGGQPLTS